MKELLAQELLAQEFMLTDSVSVIEKEVTDEDFDIDLRIATPSHREDERRLPQLYTTPVSCYASCNGTCC